MHRHNAISDGYHPGFLEQGIHRPVTLIHGMAYLGTELEISPFYEVSPVPRPSGQLSHNAAVRIFEVQPPNVNLMSPTRDGSVELFRGDVNKCSSFRGGHGFFAFLMLPL